MSGSATTVRLDLEAGDSVSIDGGRIVVSLERKSGRMARLKFVLPPKLAVQLVRPRPAIQRARLGIAA